MPFSVALEIYVFVFIACQTQLHYSSTTTATFQYYACYVKDTNWMVRCPSRLTNYTQSVPSCYVTGCVMDTLECTF